MEIENFGPHEFTPEEIEMDEGLLSVQERWKKLTERLDRIEKELTYVADQHEYYGRKLGIRNGISAIANVRAQST